MVQALTRGAPYAQPASLRVFFKKRGRMQYISHLDLMRTMTRVIVRARLPVAYSEGFNPIPRLSFAAPLSVGVESDYEILDIKITHEVDFDEVKEALNRNLCEELSVFDVAMAEAKVKDAAYAAYTLRIGTEGACDALSARVEEVLNKKPLSVVKKTKSGEKEVDLSPLVKTATSEMDGGEIKVTLELLCDNASFLNPDYLVTALKAETGILSGDETKEYYQILRTGIYLSEGKLFR